MKNAKTNSKFYKGTSSMNVLCDALFNTDADCFDFCFLGVKRKPEEGEFYIGIDCPGDSFNQIMQATSETTEHHREIICKTGEPAESYREQDHEVGRVEGWPKYVADGEGIWKYTSNFTRVMVVNLNGIPTIGFALQQVGENEFIRGKIISKEETFQRIAEYRDAQKTKARADAARVKFL